jgi:hypothetical protein
MRVDIQQREPGKAPLGALLMSFLFVLPAGAWLVQTGWVHFGTCGMKSAVGLPCLTCGATRATIHLFHGNLGQALAFQPLMMTVYAGILIWGIVSLAGFLTDRDIRVKLNGWENTAFKIFLIGAPFLNWAYLIWAGI